MSILTPLIVGPEPGISSSHTSDLNLVIHINGQVEMTIDLNDLMPINNLIEIFDKHFLQGLSWVKIAQVLPVALNLKSLNARLALDTKPYRIISTANTHVQADASKNYCIEHFILFELREFDFKDLVKGE